MKRWELKNKKQVDTTFTSEDLIELLLENRGLTEKKAISSFLQPELRDITPESVGIESKQLTKSIIRIQETIAKKEQIVVFGDYDVDGITASGILWETLTTLGAVALPYIPNRMEEGYGLSILGIDNVSTQISNVSLIITVDNGIVANAAVDYANEKGIDVIITDHHVADEAADHTLPKAYSFVHTTKLCGAGIAYVLSIALRQKLNPALLEGEDTYLELATLGTIADLVPLTAANRTIVKHGLKAMTHSKRPGLIELFRQAACDMNSIDVYHIGHIIGPRLNAAGRLESAMDSLRLLCTKDPKRAYALAYKLTETNKQRQNIMTESATHAISHIKKRPGEIKKLLFISHDTYKEGVIGLIAGKMVEEFYRPAIAVSIGEKKSKGSVRSVSGFNIIEFLRMHTKHFINVGGHPMAAGFTVENEKLVALQTMLEEKAEEMLSEEVLTRLLKIDCELPFSLLTETNYTALQQLAPFGMGNAEPTFMSKKVIIEDLRFIGKESNHVKLLLSQDKKKRIEAIGFQMREQFKDLSVGDTIDIAYTIDLNIWNGTKRLQLKIKDSKALS